MPKVYIASLNQVKVAAVQEVLSNYDVVALLVKTTVSKQPKSDEETIKGARERAKALPKDGLRIGLEAGLSTHNDKLYLVNWGVLIDEEGSEFIAGGARIPLPENIVVELKKDDTELADVMDSLYQKKAIRSHEGAVGILTNNEVRRIDIFIHIVRLLYGQYLYKIGGVL